MVTSRRTTATVKPPVEQKVKAGTTAAAATSFVVALLLQYVPGLKDLDQTLLGTVVASLVGAGLTALGAFWAAFKARHTFRPDLVPVVTPPAPPVA